MSSALLEIDSLTISAESRHGGRTAIVREVSMAVEAGETVCVVGETGSGKSLTMLAVMGLLPVPPMRVTGGEVRLSGRNLIALREHEYRLVRGAEVAMVYQNPLTSLNPTMRVGAQVAEALRARGATRENARTRSVELLDMVGIPDPERRARAFPHDFSGGMRQRVVIAIALALSPRLLIADEPTTALDATTQQQIMLLIHELQQRTGMAVVWITHDLGVVARIAERVVVMYAGKVVEHGSAIAVFESPAHPYTRGLLKSLPSSAGGRRMPLQQIPGAPPQPGHLPAGCAFAERCDTAQPRCLLEAPRLEACADGAVACWVGGRR